MKIKPEIVARARKRLGGRAGPIRLQSYYTSGRKRFYRPHYAVEKGGMLIISFRDGITRHTHAVAFPKKEHSAEFREAARGVMFGGPAHSNPGAVGTVIASEAKIMGKEFIIMNEAQFHGIKEGGKNLGGGMPGLSKKILRNYSNWRKRLFERMAEIATEQNGIFLVETGRNFSRFSEGKAKGTMQDLRSLAKELGLKAGGRDGFITFSKKGKEVIMVGDSRGLEYYFRRGTE